MVFQITGNRTIGMMRAIPDVIDDCSLAGEFGAHPIVQCAQLILVKEAARSGLGTRLLHALAEDLKARGKRTMSLRVLQNNPARVFYEKLGARLVPEGIEHDAGMFDDVVYAFDDVTAL